MLAKWGFHSIASYYREQDASVTVAGSRDIPGFPVIPGDSAKTGVAFRSSAAWAADAQPAAAPQAANPADAFLAS